MNRTHSIRSWQIRCVAISMVAGLVSIVASRWQLPYLTQLGFYGFLACLLAVLVLGMIHDKT